MRKMDKIQFQKSDLYSKEPLISSSTNSIDDLKKEIKRLEQEIDYKFSTFTNISEQIERWVQEDESMGFMSPNSTLEELDTLISKLTELNRALNETNAPQSIKLHHRSKLDDINQEHRRIRSHVHQSWEKAQLLKRGKHEPLPERSINIDNLIRERGSIHNSSSTASDLILQAQLTRERVNEQTKMIEGSTGKLKTMSTGSFPVINMLMGKIRFKRNKNMIIIGGVTAFCICFLLWWWWTTHS